MKNSILINKKGIINNEYFPKSKNNLKIEKDYNENFPRINSKYFFPLYNQNESKLSNNNNFLTDRTYKNENKNYYNKKNKILSETKKSREKKFFVNIKNIGIEEKKEDINNYNNIKNNTTNKNNYFHTLNDINIYNILKKRKKNNENRILNVLKEKDSDVISIAKNLENKILEDDSYNYLTRTMKNRNENVKNIEINNNKSDKMKKDNILKNIGINTQLSKTSTNFHQQNNKNNKMIYSYTMKKNNINDKYKTHKYKFIYSRNDNYNNNFRPIISLIKNKTLNYALIKNTNNKNNNDIKNKTTTNFKNNYKINNLFSRLLSNNIYRKVELSNQGNKKISDELVQNLLIKEIDEIEKTKRKKNEMDKIKSLRNELFQNIKIKNHFLKTENIENNNYINNPKQKEKKFLRETIENKIPYITQDMILSKLKQFDLSADVQMFDNKLLSRNDKLAQLYLDNKKELLNDKDVIMEIGNYFFHFLSNKNKNSSKQKYKDKIIMTDFNNNEDEKNLYNEEEKNIIKDIIYQLSDDLNKNLDSYKNNKNNSENSINHVINSISLAQLFEKLNKASSPTGKKRRFNKMITNKKGNIKEENTNNKIKNNKNENNNSDEEKDNKQLINKMLIHLLETNKINKEENNKILNDILEKIKDENDNTLSLELKRILSESNKLNQEKVIKNSNNINTNNLINSLSPNINENSNYISKEKEKIMEKEIKKIKKSKDKKKNKENKKKNENNEEQNSDKILSSNNDIDYEIKDMDNELNESNNNNKNIKVESYNKKLKIINKKENEIKTNIIQKEVENDFNSYENTKNKKSNISSKKHFKENLMKLGKSNKNVRFSIKNILIDTDNKNSSKNLNRVYNNNIDIKSKFNNNSFYDKESLIQKDIFDFNLTKSINSIKSMNLKMKNIDSFNDEYDDGDIKMERKYSSKSRKHTSMSMIESLYKNKRKKFHKTRRKSKKNNNIISLKNEENMKKETKEIPVNIREEMLNRKLQNFFGKIKLLKNGNVNNYEEQLKQFIDNEIDKLNDWETKEQELRINNFFSDLKLMKKRATIGGDIKFANPIKFSSTWTNFGKFK